MKKQIKTIIIATLTILTACKNDCKVVKAKFGNGNDKVVEYYDDCNDTTTFKRQTFYINGQMASEGHIVSGIENGKFKSWTEDGVLTAEWEMIEGKEHGLIKCWYDNGVKKREVILNKGIEDGIYKDWDENGKPIVDGTYKNGKKNGRWTYWEKDGNWKFRTYINDTIWGETYEYLVDSTEIKHVVGQYEKGVETGLWKWFDKDSVLYQTAIFTDGEYTGEFIEYYANGTIKSKGYLLNGDYDGEVVNFDEQGKKRKILNYKKGTKISEKNYR